MIDFKSAYETAGKRVTVLVDNGNVFTGKALCVDETADEELALNVLGDIGIYILRLSEITSIVVHE